MPGALLTVEQPFPVPRPHRRTDSSASLFTVHATEQLTGRVTTVLCRFTQPHNGIVVCSRCTCHNSALGRSRRNHACTHRVALRLRRCGQCGPAGCMRERPHMPFVAHEQLLACGHGIHACFVWTATAEPLVHFVRYALVSRRHHNLTPRPPHPAPHLPPASSYSLPPVSSPSPTPLPPSARASHSAPTSPTTPPRAHAACPGTPRTR